MTKKRAVKDKDTEDQMQRLPRFKRFALWYKKHKRLTIPLSAVIVMIIAGAIICVIPPLRYATLSLIIKKSYEIYVVDAKTSNPLYDAVVSLNNHTLKTDLSGRATFDQVPVGYHSVIVTKPLYDTQEIPVTVPILTNPIGNVSLVANGKQVNVTVINRIGGQPIDGAKITTNSASSQTRADGKAELIIPVNVKSLEATVTKDGFLPSTVTVSQETPADVSLVKTGRIYFLSKQSGLIDVVSTNLDGSDRKVLVTGTGNEIEYSTALLASRDWKYLALQSKREENSQEGESLYLIKTDTGELSRITAGKSSLALVGWSDHRFIYKESGRGPDATSWNLLSVKASDNSVAILEKSEGIRLSYSASHQQIDTPYILDGGTVVYASVWSSSNYYAPERPGNRQSGVIAVQADGSNRRFIKSYPATEINNIQTKLYKPQEIHYRVFNTNGERRENLMTVNKKIELVPPSQQKFDQSYPTFLISPDGKRAFWGEPRDGKNALFIGDNNAGDQQQLAIESEYTPYGWFTDEYVLLQKDDSELYITTLDQIKSGGTPLKISGYHKPAQGFPGYGYGYGGL